MLSHILHVLVLVTLYLQRSYLVVGSDNSFKIILTSHHKHIISDPSLHDPVPIPDESDWLACHEEQGETFKFFSKSRLNKKPTPERNTIYLLPLVFFEDAVPDESIEGLVEFASHFFNLPVKVLEISQVKDKVPSRINEYTKKPQVNASKILDHLLEVLPQDAFCLAALTLCDLYPLDSWNFVFGVSDPISRVAVYSLARYMPGFFIAKESKVPLPTAG